MKSNDDALLKFKEIIVKADKSINDSGPQISPPEPGTQYHNDWYRRKVYATEMAFDVRSTNSIVSPLIGELRFECNVKGTKASSEAEANSLPDSFNLTGQVCKATYAFQSSVWVFKKLECNYHLEGISDGGPRFEEIKPTERNSFGICMSFLPK